MNEKAVRKERECLEKGKVARMDGRKEETSHPRIAHGQRYPMPCLE